ncbi:hypothetical protein BDF19DRAFT_412777 [Syncephalis fuscata]|nr:hypothetical protein BDF19DRAFT_412777 [Syncephalis fuscata]
MACSQRLKNTFFVAIHNEIHVYKLPQLAAYSCSDTVKPQRQSILRMPTQENTTSLDTEFRTINAIHVGEVGPEEMLVAVDELGFVTAWFTAALKHPPIQLEVHESAWGIATNGPAYLLAISANSFQIVVWDLHDWFIDPESDKLYWNDAMNTHASTSNTANVLMSDKLPSISTNGHRFQPRKTTTQSVDAPLGNGFKKRIFKGHKHNVPSISMSSCGRWLASCSIDSSVRVWRLCDGQCIMQRNFESAWGWSVQFIQPSQFKYISPSILDYPMILSSCPSRDELVRSLALRHWGGWTGSEGSTRSRIQLMEALLNHIGSRSDEDAAIPHDIYSAISTKLPEDLSEEEEYEEEEEEEADHDIDSSTEHRLTSTGSLYNDHDNNSVDELVSTDPRWPTVAWQMERHLSEDVRAGYWIPANEDEDEDGEIEMDEDEDGEMEDIEERMLIYGEIISIQLMDGFIKQLLPIMTLIHKRFYNGKKIRVDHLVHYVNTTPLLPLISQNANLERGLIPLPRDMDEMSEVDTTAATIYSEDRNTLLGTDDGNSSIAADDELPVNSGNSHTGIRISVGIGGGGARSHGPVTFSLRSNSNTNINDHSTMMTTAVPGTSHGSYRSRLDSSAVSSHSAENSTKAQRPPTSNTTESLSNEFDRGILLVATGLDAYLLDVESDLEVLDHYRRVVARADMRNSRLLNPYDRLNMTKWIPELNLAIVASQKGRIALMRLVRLCNFANEDRYVLHAECYLPAFTDLPPVPLLGFFVMRYPQLPNDPLTTLLNRADASIGDSSFSYYIYILYYDGTLMAYELCRDTATANPVSMPNYLL